LKAVNATASFVLAIVFALTAALVAAAVEAPPSLMSRADRLAAARAIERDERLTLAACRAIGEAAERAVCRANARAGRRIAVAELEARYLGTEVAQQSLERVLSRAAHSVGCARRLLHT
jgi:hypothetical protein